MNIQAIPCNAKAAGVVEGPEKKSYDILIRLENDAGQGTNFSMSIKDAEFLERALNVSIHTAKEMERESLRRN